MTDKHCQCECHDGVPIHCSCFSPCCHEVKKPRAEQTEAPKRVLRPLRPLTKLTIPFIGKQVRFPRSKKKRIQKKWRNNRKNWDRVKTPKISAHDICSVQPMIGPIKGGRP